MQPPAATELLCLCLTEGRFCLWLSSNRDEMLSPADELGKLLCMNKLQAKKQACFG